jgi:putative transposase
MRNALAHADKSGRRVVSAFIATAFAKDDTKIPKLAALMDSTEHDALAFMTFPQTHRAKLHSPNPIERLHGEIKRRTNVVSMFPNEATITRPISALIMEQSEEWPKQILRAARPLHVS